MSTVDITHFHLFCGLGGGALIRKSLSANQLLVSEARRVLSYMVANKLIKPDEHGRMLN